MMRVLNSLQTGLDKTRAFDFLAPLAIRLYLAPVFWMAGTGKLAQMEATIEWFGNAEWGLGLPFPTLLAWVAALTETIGAVCLLLGLGVRWAALPLMFTMIVAAVTVHWDQGWPAIATADSAAAQRLAGLLEWLAQEYPGRHTFVTELAQPVALNNGIEFAATYFILLLVLFFAGAGRYISADYWIGRHHCRENHAFHI